MDQNTQFLQNLERLSVTIADPENFELEAAYAVVRDICAQFHICKAVTEYFTNPEAERTGNGTSYVCVDSGEETEEAVIYRAVFSGMIIARSRAYRAKGSEPWTEEERARINLVERLLVNTVGRFRTTGMLEHATLYDDAGYRNIRFFNLTMNRLGAEQQLSRYAAVRFNLKHFALINQELGRDVTDRIMRRYIDNLTELIGGEGTVCRLGGDNFVALCPKENLEKVIRCFEGSPVQFSEDDHGRVMLAASAGIFLIPEDYYYHDFGDVMDRIINAYTTAKAGFTGDIVYSNEHMLEEKERAMRIRQQFPVAMQNREILVFYQPKINIETNSLIGAEALSRWYQNGRLILPMEFIPVLEQSMDICKLDFYVLDCVCRDLRRWLDEGKPAVRISVNLSRRHLIDLDLLDHILSIIDRNRVPHRYIEIELTETTSDVEFKDLKRIVKGLQDAGIATSVDDFGIGYSSLNLIREIPWDILKVDKNFLPKDESAAHNRQNVMFRHVVNMAREIGLTCVAEGVETAEQVAILRNHGCEIAQGFYFDKPLPVREFERRLERHFYPKA